MAQPDNTRANQPGRNHGKESLIMEVGQKVIKGLKVGAMFRLAAQIFTWLNTLILIRLLTPDDYGLMAMAMAFIGIFALVGDFGIAKAIIQVKALSEETLKQAFTVNIISSLIFFLVFFLAAPFIAEFFNEPRVTLLVQAVACQHLIMIFHTLPYALASRNMLYKEREKVQFYTTIATSIFTLALATTGFGVWALILGHLFMRAVSTIGFFWLQPCWFLPAMNFRGFSKIAAFSCLTTVNDLLRYLYILFPSISIGRLMNKTDLGVFSVARSLANLPSSKIGELLNHLCLSSFAKLQNERGVAGLYLLKSTQLASLALFPLYLGMYATAPELIPLMLSEKWAPAIVPFQILCLASPLNLLAEILSTATTAIGLPEKNTIVLLGTLLCLPALLMCIQYGITGICLALLAISFFSFATHIKVMLHIFEIKLADYLIKLVPGFFSAGLMLVTLEVLRAELAGILTPWTFLFLTVLSGAMIYLLTLLFFFRSTVITAIGYLKH
ncbi:MAG: lipopolysaccharide biosynthesis protein [Endozoicomonas sp.]